MTDKERPPTISEVADAAGVDRSSVSRAFSRPELLSAATVASIKAAAERLGYVPNRSARALSTGRHGNVALIVPDIADPYFPPLIRAAQMEADRSDFCVFLGNTDEDPRQEDKLLMRFAGQVEGVILASPRLPDERIRSYAASKRLVLVNRDVEGVPRVLIDSGPGIAAAVKHLADCGHRRIAYVGGPSTSWSNKQRRSAVKKMAARLGLEMVTIPAQLASYDAGRQAVPAILESRATGVIAFDDLTAQGVMAGLGARNLRSPRDLAVIACDNVLGAATYPPLTTISNRSAEAGKAAMTLLLDILGTKTVRDVRYVLDTHLVERSTSGIAVRRSEPAP